MPTQDLGRIKKRTGSYKRGEEEKGKQRFNTRMIKLEEKLKRN